MNYPNYFLSLLFIVIGMQLFSQPELNYGSNYYIVGEDYVSQVINPSGFEEGADGANQTWDFSSMQITGATFTNSIIDPADTPEAASFPTSNIVITDESAGMNTYFVQDENHFALTGSAIDLISQVIAFDNEETLFTWPFTTTSEVNDTYTASYMTNGLPATQEGEITTTALGYGTITLPNSTVIENAMKIRRVEEILNTIDVGNGIEVETLFESTIIFWMIPSSTQAVLTHYESVITIGGIPQAPIFDLQMFDPTITDVNERENNFTAEMSIFPNPSSDIANIKLTSSISNNYTVKVYTPNGRLVYYTEGEIIAGIDSRIKIPVNKLSTGAYLVEVSFGDSTKLQKILIKS